MTLKLNELAKKSSAALMVLSLALTMGAPAVSAQEKPLEASPEQAKAIEDWT
ncbi:MAG: hypothetical protein WBN03_09635 [Desulfobacterales bacterium]